jgi:hypothetical protein
MLEICRLLPPSLRRVPHQQVRDNSRLERVASEPWRLGAVVPEQVLVHRAILRKATLHKGSHSRLHQKGLGYSLGLEVRFPAFLRPELLQVSDKSGFEAALSGEPRVKVKVAEWLYAGEESETKLLAAAVLAALRAAASACCLGC